MAPRSAEESSISHQRGAGMPRNATGWGTAVSVSGSAAAVAPSGCAVVPSNEYQSRLPLAYRDAASVSSVLAAMPADTANWYSIRSSVHAVGPAGWSYSASHQASQAVAAAVTAVASAAATGG